MKDSPGAGRDSHAKFSRIRDELNKLYQQLDQQNQYTDSVYNEKIEYLRLLEQKVIDRFDEESKFRKEVEKKSLLLIEERFTFLMNELIKEKKNRNESMEVEAFMNVLCGADSYYKDASYVQKRKITKILFSNIVLDHTKRLHIAVKP